MNLQGGRESAGYQAAVRKFPTIPEDRRGAILAIPDGGVRVVIDTDAKNEIDDQFALAWALLSQDILQIEALYAAPFSFALYREDLLRAHHIIQNWSSASGEDRAFSMSMKKWVDGLAEVGVDPTELSFESPETGMEQSHQEILTVLEKMRLEAPGPVLHGSREFLGAAGRPERSPAAEDLIARASGSRPLFVVAIGAITNIVSAMLLEPEIISNIVVIWTASYPTIAPHTAFSLNLEQDLVASQLLFDSGVPLVYLPGHQVGGQLRLSLPEIEAWFKGRGAIGDYLHAIFLDNPLRHQRGRWNYHGTAWTMWDLINIAWLVNPDWVPSELISTPILTDAKRWSRPEPGRPLMREAYNVDRNAIFVDFLRKLDRHAGI